MCIKKTFIETPLHAFLVEVLSIGVQWGICKPQAETVMYYTYMGVFAFYLK